jgi:hypothetical protein
MPNAAIIKLIYYGISPSKEQLSYRHVYLNKNPALESPLNAVYDIDSYYGITDTLAFAIGGINVQTVLNKRQNIQQSIHGHVKIRDSAGHRRELRDIPYQYLGRLGNDATVDLWFLYPRCYHDSNGRFTRLTDEQLTH